MRVRWKLSFARVKGLSLNQISCIIHDKCIYHVGLASAPCILSKPQVLVTVKALTICICVKLNALTNSVLKFFFKYNINESQSDLPAQKSKNVCNVVSGKQPKHHHC